MAKNEVDDGVSIRSSHKIDREEAGTPHAACGSLGIRDFQMYIT